MFYNFKSKMFNADLEKLGMDGDEGVLEDIYIDLTEVCAFAPTGDNPEELNSTIITTKGGWSVCVEMDAIEVKELLSDYGGAVYLTK